MARADYRLCDKCGRKAFYDATLDYDFREPRSESMKMKITQEIEVQPFMTPNFVITRMPTGKRQDGFQEAPKLPLADVDAATLSMLCDQFRWEVFAKAGKKDPRLT